jgi:hypothetical protein
MTKQDIQAKLDSFQQLFVQSDSDLLPPVEEVSAKIVKLAGEPGTHERIAQYAAMVAEEVDLPLEGMIV